jgi:hypothetical protein
MDWLRHAWCWIASQKAWLSLGGVVTFGGTAWKVWEHFRNKKLHRLSSVLMDYWIIQKAKEPNLQGMSKEALSSQLGKDAEKIDAVLELMRKEGLALRLDYPPTHWKIF